MTAPVRKLASEAHARGLALCVYAALLDAAAPRWPDDWDGVGFVEAIREFDLARFHPHPPGYPVYVALLRAAATLARDPMRACAWVAAVSGALAIALTYLAARREAGTQAALMAATLVGVSPGVWHACSGVGSEAPALACLAACAWGLTAAREGGWAPASALGLGAGLGLGVRLSWGPLFLAALAMAPRAQRARAWLTALVAGAAWAIPLVATVGAAKLYALCAAHLSGHAARWGGTIATEPGGIRLVWLARDVFVDGLGVGSDPLGIAIGALALAAALQTLVLWRAAGWRRWQGVLFLVVPYLLWIGLGQNLRDQPRHALPLVALLAAALALSAGRSLAFAVTSVLALLLGLRSASDSYARRTIPPPGQQLVNLARAEPSPARLAVYGVASIRFFELSDHPSIARAAGSLGEVSLALTRLPELPARVWVTSELAGLNDASSPLRPVANLCRPPRLDRRSPCLSVYEFVP